MIASIANSPRVRHTAYWLAWIAWGWLGTLLALFVGLGLDGAEGGLIVCFGMLIGHGREIAQQAARRHRIAAGAP